MIWWLNKYTAGGAVALALLTLIVIWYGSKIEAAYDRGYAEREAEIIRERSEYLEAALKKAENVRIQEVVRVETVYRDRDKIREVVRYVEQRIDDVPVDQCSALPVEWVRLHNLAARGECANCY